MKMIGKKSVASALKAVIDILFVLVIVLWSLAVFSFFTASLAGGEIDHGDYVNLHIPYKLKHAGPQEEIQPLSSSLWGMAVGMKITRELAFNPTKWWILFLIVVFVTLVVLVFVFILLQLRRFLASAAEGNPFTLDNTRRIRTIGIVIIASELLIKSMMIGAAVIIDSAVKMEEAKLVWGELISAFSLPSLFLGVVVLIIAEIFRLGVKMREDQELTI